MKIKVYYEDTDCGGVVYHSNYINFCERARSDLFFKKGLSPHNKNNFFVVKRVEADYIKPAIFGDDLEIKSKMIEQKSASLVMQQDIYRDNELIFTGLFKLAYLSNFKPTRIPKELFDIFK